MVFCWPLLKQLHWGLHRKGFEDHVLWAKPEKESDNSLFSLTTNWRLFLLMCSKRSGKRVLKTNKKFEEKKRTVIRIRRARYMRIHNAPVRKIPQLPIFDFGRKGMKNVGSISEASWRILATDRGLNQTLYIRYFKLSIVKKGPCNLRSLISTGHVAMSTRPLYQSRVCMRDHANYVCMGGGVWIRNFETMLMSVTKQGMLSQFSLGIIGSLTILFF